VAFFSTASLPLIGLLLGQGLMSSWRADRVVAEAGCWLVVVMEAA
jgi:hypothetical protein